jgi:N-acyl-D-amino-acid deacylase
VTSFDILIKGGMVFDGRRSPRYLADIGILDGVIARIGMLDGVTAKKVIDARGCNVAPGIIDLHTHYDSQVFWDPYCSPSGWHGVTSVVIGNCGFGFAPVRPEERERAMLAMTRNEAVPLTCMQKGMPWDWVSFPEFLASLERKPKSINLLPLIPLNPLMAWVMGIERGKAGAMPTDAEHAEMGRLINEAMDAGAGGISAQRLGWASPQRDYDGKPMITDVMHDQTMLYLAKVIGERGEGVIQYSHTDFTAMISGDVATQKKVKRHIQEVARISGRPVLVAGAGETDRQFIAESREMGLRIYGVWSTSGIDGMEFTLCIAESPGSFDSAGDAWAQATTGSKEEVKAKLRDPKVRDELRAALPSLQKIFGPLTDWVLLLAATPEMEKYDQSPLGPIAKSLGFDDPVDAFCEINVREDLMTRWHGTLTRPALLPDKQGEGTVWSADAQAVVAKGESSFKKIGEDPYGCPCISDGGAHTKFMTAGHFGIFYLMQYVREHGWVSLEDAHWKLSGLPALYAGFVDRGTLVEGAPADLFIYDFAKLGITDFEEVHDYPGGEWRRIDRPVGLHYVIVNGEVTMDHNVQTNVDAGQLLRFGRGSPARPQPSRVAAPA